METVRTIILRIKNKPEKFHVVWDDFLIQAYGMLGPNYFKEQEAVIKYHKKVSIITGYVMHPILFISEEEYMDSQGNESVISQINTITNSEATQSDTLDISTGKIADAQ